MGGRVPCPARTLPQPQGDKGLLLFRGDPGTPGPLLHVDLEADAPCVSCEAALCSDGFVPDLGISGEQSARWAKSSAEASAGPD